MLKKNLPSEGFIEFFWQHLKEDDAMLSSLYLGSEVVFLVLVFSCQSTFEFQSLLFSKKVSRVTFTKKVKAVCIFF